MLRPIFLHPLHLFSKVKLSVAYFKTIFVYRQLCSTRTSFAYPNSFYSFPPCAYFPLAMHTMHLFNLDLAPFHSAGVSLLPGQWFLPVSLTMLCTASLLKGLSNLSAFSNSSVHTPRRKYKKTSFHH